MNHIEEAPEPSRVMVLGDVHGNGHAVVQSIDYASTNHVDVIIQVGDFGFWVPGSGTERYLDRVATRAAEREVQFYWLDGNHEDHSRRDTFSDADTEWVHYLPRGTRWSWWDKTFMAVGGAFSIDRYMRTEGVSVWEEELLTDEDVEFANREPLGIDVILAHDCPNGVDIPGIGPDSKPRGGADSWPPAMLYGAGLHRRKIREIWEANHPQLWIHGHYHVPYGPVFYGPTKFYGMGLDGMKMTDAAMILTKEDLK